MYSYKVKQTNRTAAVMMGAMFSLALVMLLFSMLGIGFRSILQLFMLIFIVFAILIAERYYMSSFEYVINDRVGDYDLVVIRTSGKRSNTVCRLAFSGAGEFISVSAKDKEKPRPHGHLYDYTGSLFPERYYLFTFPEENVTIKLEPDAEFASVIEKLLKVPDGVEI